MKSQADSMARRRALESFLNVWTHRPAFLASVVALVALSFAAIPLGAHAFAGAASFGIAVSLVYFASTVYHAYPREKDPSVKRLLRKFDHIAIFILIASTHFGCMLIMVDVSFKPGLAAVVLALAAAGVILKIYTVESFVLLSIVLYLLLGWLGVFVFGFERLLHPDLKVGLMMLGGLIYTVGVLFFVLDRIPYFHSIWHLFVVLGSLNHYLAFFIAIGEQHSFL